MDPHKACDCFSLPSMLAGPIRHGWIFCLGPKSQEKLTGAAAQCVIGVD